MAEPGDHGPTSPDPRSTQITAADLHPDVLARAQAAEGIGFVVVEAESDCVTAVRMRWHWDCFTRITCVVRIRRASTITQTDATAAIQQLRDRAGTLDPSRIPRGFQQGREVLDIVLVDQVDADTTRWATSWVGKGLGESARVVLVTPDGQAHAKAPLWGGAFWPKTKHVLDVVGACTPGSEPLAPVALGITLLVWAPTWLAITASCCGLPLLVGGAVVMSEKAPVAVLTAGAP